LASEYDGDYANNRLLGQEQNMSHFWLANQSSLFKTYAQCVIFRRGTL
jgi:hypothetical protein